MQFPNNPTCCPSVNCYEPTSNPYPYPPVYNLNLNGGLAGEVVFQAAPSVTAFTAQGQVGQLLQSNYQGAPTWISQSDIVTGNLAGGLAGQLPIQTAPSTTGFIYPNNIEVTATGSITPRTLANRFSDVVNVLDYGADPTGTTDSTSAIQATIASNRIVYFPEGTYLITGISISSVINLEIIGVPGNGTIIQLTNNGNAFNLVNSTNITFRNVGLTCTPSLTSSIGINVNTNSTVYLFNSEIYYFYNAGVKIASDSGSIVSENLFLSCARDGVSGQLDCNGSNDFIFTNNQFGTLQGVTPIPQYGVKLTNSSNGLFQGNMIFSCNIGALFSTCLYNRIIANRFELSNQDGCQLNSCGEIIFVGNWINDNSVQTINTYNGLTISGTYGSTFSNNIFYNWNYPTEVQKYAIQLNSSSQTNTFSSNKCAQTGTAYIVLDSSCVGNNFDTPYSFSSTTQITGGSTTYLSSTGASNYNSSGFVNPARLAFVRMYVAVDTAPASTNTVTATLFVNGVSTGISAVITGTAFLANVFTPLYISSESLISVQLVYSASASASIPRVLLQAATI